MPCRSDHLEPTAREIESREVANLILYVNSKLKRTTDGYIHKAAKNVYGDVDRVDEFTAALCYTLGTLTKEQTEKIIYNAHDKMSRKLADWWERHQAFDREREANEAAAAKKKALRKSALNKLTTEEIEALDLD